jgi:DNA-binding LytR/AlgR family response regulator
MGLCRAPVHANGAMIYVNLHVGDRALLYRAALNRLAESLDPQRFIRVHRSAISDGTILPCV